MNRFLIVILLIACLVSLGPPGTCATIGQAKAGPLAMQVSVTGVATLLEPTECYLESPNRSAGIRVIADTTGFALGDTLRAIGFYQLEDGEPVINDATLESAGGAASLAPLGMANSRIGGGFPGGALDVWDYLPAEAPGESTWVKRCGLATTGLLVRTWGAVRSVYYSRVTGAKWFYIDDGFGAVSDLSDRGVLVYGDADVRQGQFVVVDGISSVEPSFDDETKLVRVLRTRSSDDVQVSREAAGPEYPFSDEFDGPVLDWRWAVQVNPPDELSLTLEPGWLAMTCYSGYYQGPSIILCLPEPDWNLEFKVRVGPFNPLSQTQGFLAVAWGTDEITGGIWWLNGLPSVVVLACGGVGPLVGDTVWFRLRNRGQTLWASASFDGVTYSAENSAEPWPAGPHRISIYSFSSPASAGPFTAYLDYVRYTRVEQ